MFPYFTCNYVTYGARQPYRNSRPNSVSFRSTFATLPSVAGDCFLASDDHSDADVPTITEIKIESWPKAKYLNVIEL